MSNETDIVIDLEQQAKNRTSQLSDADAWKHSVEHRAIQEITKLRAERDAWKRAAEEGMASSVRAAREMRERCAKAAEGAAPIAAGNYYRGQREQSAKVAARIRALPDTPAVIATDQTGGGA